MTSNVYPINPEVYEQDIRHTTAYNLIDLLPKGALNPGEDTGITHTEADFLSKVRIFEETNGYSFKFPKGFDVSDLNKEHVLSKLKDGFTNIPSAKFLSDEIVVAHLDQEWSNLQGPDNSNANTASPAITLGGPTAGLGVEDINNLLREASENPGEDMDRVLGHPLGPNARFNAEAEEVKQEMQAAAQAQGQQRELTLADLARALFASKKQDKPAPPNPFAGISTPREWTTMTPEKRRDILKDNVAKVEAMADKLSENGKIAAILNQVKHDGWTPDLGRSFQSALTEDPAAMHTYALFKRDIETVLSQTEDSIKLSADSAEATRDAESITEKLKGKAGDIPLGFNKNGEATQTVNEKIAEFWLKMAEMIRNLFGMDHGNDHRPSAPKPSPFKP